MSLPVSCLMISAPVTPDLAKVDWSHSFAISGVGSLASKPILALQIAYGSGVLSAVSGRRFISVSQPFASAPVGAGGAGIFAGSLPVASYSAVIFAMAICCLL